MSAISTKKLVLIIVGAAAIVIPGLFFSVYFIVKNLSQPRTSSKQVAALIRSNDPVSDRDDVNNAFQTKMIDFYSMVDMAKGIFPLDTSANGKTKTLADIKDIGIYYWTRNLEILDEVGELEIDAVSLKRVQILKDYCELYKSCYELMYKAIEEDSKAYDDEINRYLMEVDLKVGEYKVAGN